mgnify:CR=1 FL=1
MFYTSIIFEIFAHKYDFFVQLVQSILKYNRGIDMQNVLLRLREVQPSLSSTERQIAQFILDNPDETTTLTIRELARRSFSSPSSSLSSRDERDINKAWRVEIMSETFIRILQPLFVLTVKSFERQF